MGLGTAMLSFLLCESWCALELTCVSCIVFQGLERSAQCRLLVDTCFRLSFTRRSRRSLAHKPHFQLRRDKTRQELALKNLEKYGMMTNAYITMGYNGFTMAQDQSASNHFARRPSPNATQ